MCVRVDSNLYEMSCKKWVKEKTKAEAKYKRENSCVDQFRGHLWDLLFSSKTIHQVLVISEANAHSKLMFICARTNAKYLKTTRLL